MHKKIVALPVALALTALLALASSVAPALGSRTAAACRAAPAGSGHRARACAGRNRKAHRHAKVRRHHAKHPSIKKKKAAPRPVSAPVPAEQPQSPAGCEDATRPSRAADGSFACGDGSEPVCANGLEPSASGSGAAPSCPVVSTGSGWQPATCEDGSAPAPGAGGGFACADESEPECEDGSDPVPASDGSMPMCPAAGAAPSSSASAGIGSAPRQASTSS